MKGVPTSGHDSILPRTRKEPSENGLSTGTKMRPSLGVRRISGELPRKAPRLSDLRSHGEVDAEGVASLP